MSAKKNSSAKPKTNPFAQDVAEKRPGPTTLVIFGASGDLAARKLIPAVYNLLVGGLLPDRLRVVGVDLVLDDFPKTARAAIEAHSRTDLNQEAWADLESSLEAVKGDFSDPALFKELADRLAAGDDEGPTQRVLLSRGRAEVLRSARSVAERRRPGSWRRPTYEAGD